VAQGGEVEIQPFKFTAFSHKMKQYAEEKSFRVKKARQSISGAVGRTNNAIPLRICGTTASDKCRPACGMPCHMPWHSS